MTTPTGQISFDATSPDTASGGPGPETSSLLSAVLPGAGQWARGQKRWIVYTAAELTGWLLVLDRRHDADRLRERYREIAWSSAREGLSQAPRTEGDFRYYETMSHWERSGSFDTDPGAEGVQPETDPSTFNGSIWVLATDIYFPGGGQAPEPGDPLYEEALAYYLERSYSDRFLWDWSAGGSDWIRYRGTITESDDRRRQATLFTGLIVANHLLSAVDAYISARLGEATEGAADVSARLSPPRHGAGLEPRLDVALLLRLGGR